ncbi:MAG: glycosyltransferase family 1 protein [Merismopedia sp. SIO2A8]|nr:glycosyltransferase family 1 protein [Merismopedia sp. SIO2A8]
MKILLLTIGSRGDVQPFIALGKGLVAAGHDVAICTSRHFESFVTSHGIGYLPLNNDMIEFMDSQDGRRAMETSINLFAMMMTGIRLWPKVLQMNNRQVKELWNAAESFQPNLIVFHKKAIGAEDFAEKLGCRCMLGFYLPMYEPSTEMPAFSFPRLPLGGWYNRFTYRIIEFATRAAGTRFIRPWRKEQGLDPKANRHREHADGTKIASMHAYSPSVLPRPTDWPTRATVTGYWFLNEPHFLPPNELTRFLDDGEPPIYVGFGSIFGLDPISKTKTIIEGVRQSGARAILASGWGGLDLKEFDLPDNILAIEKAPHDWLFPRVSAVVHHGGCGTTAAGLRAGRPTIICPFFGDQPFWGNIVHRLGAGPKPIMQRTLTAEKLAIAICETLSSDAIRKSAEVIGEKIRKENGVENAIAFIESYMQSHTK